MLNFLFGSLLMCRSYTAHSKHSVAQSAEAAEYTDCLPGYDVKESDGEVQVMLELLDMLGGPSLQSVPTLAGVVAPDWVLSIGQIEPFDI